MLPINFQGDNPQQPSVNAESYLPDQLIAGVFPLTTVNGTITGAQKYLRGTIMGQVLDGVVSNIAGKAATGTATFNAQPVVGDTVTLNGTVLTFIAEGDAPGALEVNLGDTVAQTIENFIAVASASADAQLVKFHYVGDGIIVHFNAVTGGTGGNALTLATTSAGIALSGGTLAGGAANTGNGTFGALSLLAGARRGTYKLVATDATHFNAFDPDGDALAQVIVGTAYADELGFTITAGGTAFVANDQFLLTVGEGNGAWKISNANAVDGSQEPSAVLVDDSDATLGDVFGGLYQTGEFNQTRIWFDPSWTVAALAGKMRKYSIFLKPCVSARDPLT